MTEQSDCTPADVIVIGAGLAGLAAAATTARAGLRTVVVEAQAPGGRARTDERRGFHFNQGAHALYLGGPGVGVLQRLGVPHAGGPPAVADAYGLADDRLSLLPATAAGLARTRLVTGRGKAQLARYLGFGLARLDPERLGDRSAEDWLNDLCLRADATAVIRSVTRVATYCGDLSVISADAAARQLQLAVKPGVSYLHGGWQTLVDGLLGVTVGAGAEVLTHTPAYSVEPDGPAVAVRMGGDDRRVMRAGAVVLAGLAPPAAAGLLPADPRWTGLGPPATVACLDLGVRRVPSPRIVFGIDDPLYLSTHCQPADLAPPGHAVVQTMRYGTRTADVDRAVLTALAARVGIGADDVVEQRFLARMPACHAVPRPGDGLRGRPTIDAAGVPGVFVSGDWVGPVGLLADAALASAETAALAAARHVAKLAA